MRGAGPSGGFQYKLTGGVYCYNYSKLNKTNILLVKVILLV